MALVFNPFTGNFDNVMASSSDMSFSGGSLNVNGDITLDSGGAFTTTVQAVTPTANRTISFPDQTGTVGLVSGATGNIQYNNAGQLAGTGDLNADLNWTDPLVTYTGLKVNVTDTGSAADSNLVDIQSNGTSQVVVDDDGNVGIGTTSPAANLEVEHVRGGTPNLLLQNIASGCWLRMDGASAGISTSLIYATGPLAFRVGSSYTERARIARSAYFRLSANSGGIQFNGDTAAANALDDYEEGTWTPTIVGTSTAGTGTYSTQVGRYTKIGRQVYCVGTLIWTAHTGTGNMRLEGLPFSSLNVSELFNAAVFSYVANITMPANSILMGDMPNNTSRINLRSVVTGGETPSVLTIDPAGNLYFSITYQTN